MRLISIANLGELHSGLLIPRVEPDQTSPYGVVQYRDIDSSGQLSFSSETFQIPSEPKTAHLLRDGDILIRTRGHFSAHHILAAPPNTVISYFFFVLRVADPTKVLPEYLAWFLNQPPAQKFLGSGAQGSAMKTISIKLLSELRVPLLPTNKQELVVKMERSRRAYLENLKQLERASEKLANGFIQKLFPQEIGA